MPLLGPNKEDIKKLHSEITQIVNQRFIICTIAITIFGVTIAWIIQKTPLPTSSSVGGFVYIVATILSFLLLTLNILHTLLKGMMRILTTYLIVTEASNWEKDWIIFRRSTYPYKTYYSKAQTFVFLVLNAITIAFPLILACVYSIKLEPVWGLVMLLIVGITGEIVMYGIGYRNWTDNELSARNQWILLKEA